MSDDININIRARDQASAAFNSARVAATGFFKSLGGVGGIAAGLGVGFGLNQIIGFAQSATHEMLEARKAAKQLDAVIRSTGGAAGVGAAQVKKLADELQRTTNFEDDVTTRASAVMLTFTKIGNEIFPDAIKAAADMSAALGQELQQSVIQLGKALNDPIAGITSLKRVGVSFTEAQLKQIKALIETNDLLGAQKLILAELKTEFAGAAEANSDALTRMGNAWKQFKEDMAEGAVAIVDALNWVRKNMGTPDPYAARDAQNAAPPMSEPSWKLGAMGLEFKAGGGPSRFKGVDDGEIVEKLRRFGSREAAMSLSAVGRPFANIAGGIGDALGGLGRRGMGLVQNQWNADAAMKGPDRNKILQALGGNPKGSDLMARTIFGQKDPFAGKPKEQDFFKFFEGEAWGIDKKKRELSRTTAGGSLGLESRFLSSGVGYDPSTQTAKNTAATAQHLKDMKKQQDQIERHLKELNAKTPRVVARLGGAGAGGF